MEIVKFGIIGLGLMGREFASAAMRWNHLSDIEVKPEIVSICDINLTPEMEQWYRESLSTVQQVFTDYLIAVVTLPGRASQGWSPSRRSGVKLRYTRHLMASQIRDGTKTP